MSPLETKLISSTSARAVLQPTCNREVGPKSLDRRNSFTKIAPKTPSPPPPPPRTTTKTKPTSPSSPKLRSPRPPAIKRGNDNNTLTSSSDKITLPKVKLTRSVSSIERKKSKNIGMEPCLMMGYSSSLITESPGSIAAVRREQMALQNAERKMKIAHYGRSKSAKFESKLSPLVQSLGNIKTSETPLLERRCTSITPNSDPLFVSYHDEEWGVPVHDDKMLFELLVLSGAQVGSDWTSILRRRQDFREAFSGYEAEIVANFTEKQIILISTQYVIDIGRVRGVVDNAKSIIQIKKEFGSFDNYIWGFVNNKPISPQYKFAHKIPVKTSKSESISKDMVRRGLRTVGPSAVHSFMQAAGLTNDHLITCYRHLQCTTLGSSRD
ncbi:unnamed protein product [Amaranthus hypochondriacus]